MEKERKLEERIESIDRRLNHISTDIKWIKKLIYLILASLIISQGVDISHGAVANQTWVINDVKACPYNTTEYVRGVFDCSNMAKMLYDYLTERGHQCIIVYIENETYEIRHNFLFVDGYAIEPTTKDFAWWYYNKWIRIDKFIYLDGKRLYGKAWEYPKRW